MRIDEAEHINNKVVDFLKEERIRQGISQYKLAQQTGISKTSIAFIERYENKPTLRTLLILADGLNIKLSDILRNLEK